MAVAWSIKNRVANPQWWGSDFPSVLMKKWQYSSMNWNDPNSQKFPKGNEPSWQDALRAAVDVFMGAVQDPTVGADSYFDNSIPAPAWATPEKHTVDVGAFRFYKIR